MKIPYKYNPMGCDSQDVSSGALVNVRGVFTYLSNGNCNQSAMSMSGKALIKNNISKMVVSNSGVANDIRQYSSTLIDIKSGGTVSKVDMISNCSITNGGILQNASIGSHGYISNIGILENVNMKNYCTVYVQGSTGTASNVKLNGYSCCMYVSSACVVSDVGVNISQSFLYLYSGASGVNISINDAGARLYLSSGSFLSNISLNSGAYINIQPSAIVKNVIAYSGNVYVSNDCSVSGVTLHSGGIYIYANGSVSGVTLSNSDGFLSLASYAVATDVNIVSGGKLCLTLSETDNLMSINGICSKGTFAGNGTFISGLPLNTVYVNDYASIVDCEINGYASFSNKGCGSNIALDSGNAVIKSNGVVNSITVNTDVSVSIFDYGTLMNGMFSSNARCTVYNGGTLENAIIQSGAYCSVYQNAKANSVVISGDLYVSYFGSASNISVDSCGSLFLQQYGNIENVSLFSSACYSQEANASCHSIYCDGGRLLGSINVDTITYGSHGAVYSYYNSVGISNQSYGDNVSINMRNYCSVSSCSFGNGGVLSLNSCGTVNNCNFGDALLSMGVSAHGTNVSFFTGGTAMIGSRGSVNLFFASGGSASLYGASGGTASFASNGWAVVHAGDNLQLTMENGGTLCVINKTIQSSWNVDGINTLIFSNTGTYNYSGSVISNTFEFASYSLIIHSMSLTTGGKIYCSGQYDRMFSFNMDGGSVYLAGSDTYINNAVISGGVLTMDSNAALYSASINNCSILVSDTQCHFNNITIGNNGVIDVMDSNSFEYVKLSNGAVLDFNSNKSSCRAFYVTINDGAVFNMAGQGDTATYVSVLSGGSLHVGSNCTANSVASSAGAIITVDEGGIITYI